MQAVIHLKRIFEAARDHEAFRELSARMASGDRHAHAAGLTGGARAVAIAHAILAQTRPVLVLVKENQDALHLSREIRFFLSLFSDDAPPVIHLPSLEVDPYRGLSVHPETAAARAEALWLLLSRERLVAVASARAACVRLPLPGTFLAACLDVEREQSLDPAVLRRHLIRIGYVEDDPVSEPGEFSLRGGIVDLFPPQLERPVRIEFFGDRVETLRSFDPETQRSVASLASVQIVPMREFCPGEEMLRSWAEKGREQWGDPYLPHLTEELERAGEGEIFPAFEFLLPAVFPLESSLFGYLQGYRIVLANRASQQVALEKYHMELFDRYADRVEAHKPVLAPDQIFLTAREYTNFIDRFPRLEVDELALDGPGPDTLVISTQNTRRYHGNIREVLSDLVRSRDAGEKTVFLFSNLGRAERVRDILREYELPSHLCTSEETAQPDEILGATATVLGVGYLSGGFFLPSARLRVLTGSDIFDEPEVGPAPRRPGKSRRALFMSDFRDLRPGDYVVHVEHGIGQFQGLKNIELEEGAKEFVVLTYQDEARLYVPVERLDLIQKYSNVGGAPPTLDRLGGTSWSRTKSRIKKSMRDMAEELLRLYAERKTVPGFEFSGDTPWQQEFEDSFEFDLTPDQIEAVAAVKADMERSRPMDRVLCGDVGYGKTEVAMRAAFKAVMDGKQVAVLAPTTVLAFQHSNTFRQRFTAFPIRIELLSRFRSSKELKEVLEDLEAGKVDIVIGTHRLLSRDVAFKDLGLVVVDEEQRFGVAHKERLKALKTKVDVLTLSATPIPRTLHMALLGLRDMSIIETPPKNRLAIQTAVVRFDPDVVRSAIEMELARNGQVYFVHNRVETIDSAAAMIQQLVPQARIGIAHGQMSERALERVMLKFVGDELDILVATTIIENGLDIPRVNTIVINRADLYGLSQLYQLRGRVGRSDRRAYAYLLVHSEDTLTEVAQRRLAAIREFSDLGTGFRVAAMDLEIRGAGNLLGGEQHGHIDAVGFDLYASLLEQAVQELQGRIPAEEISTTINLHMDIRIPETYIGDSSQRLRMYKRISSAADPVELEGVRQELVDRYGKYPEQVDHLFAYARIRQQASGMHIQSIERSRDQVCFKFLESSDVEPRKIMQFLKRRQGVSFSPQGVLSMEVGSSTPKYLFETVYEVLEEMRS